MPTITHSQITAIRMAKDQAATAERTLRRRAGDGAKARPSLADINGALDGLASVQRLLAIALEANPAPAERPPADMRAIFANGDNTHRRPR